MFRIKRIDRYIISEFFGLFFSTLAISIFILLMQFVWQHVNDLVGKGLGLSILAEFFWYSILSIIPLALPLSILLASLMTFGNLGEKMELSAMKASGISLFRIMRSLFVFILFVCIGAIFFSNNILPKAQTKLWTLVFSMRQTSPELEIPVNEFYSGINGYNLYVRGIDHERKTLKNIMIYDFSGGFNNASVMVADSARIQLSQDKYYLLLTVYNGESFENMKKQEEYDPSNRLMPYRRETFGKKEILIDFNSNFNKQDESVFKDQHISKNIVQLNAAIDSSRIMVDSITKAFRENYILNRYIFLKSKFTDGASFKNYNADSLFNKMSREKKLETYDRAIVRAAEAKTELVNNSQFILGEEYIIRRYGIEWHRKFTLSFACLIFFFIGAPLGAIIRKGGLGSPLIISVIFFIVYFIIDNSGFKMAREGITEVWKGIWLSSAVLFPIGVFITYKAATDSGILNIDTYVNVFKKLGSQIKRKKIK